MTGGKDIVVRQDERPASHQRRLARMIADAASPKDVEALQSWSQRLLEIHASTAPLLIKALRALSFSTATKVVLPVLRATARSTKRHVWDNRSTSARLGLGGMLVGATLFGGKNAGIAALGTAVGVPLWVVFGAGASFLNVLREEFLRSKANVPKGDPSYTVIDATRVDG